MAELMLGAPVLAVASNEGSRMRHSQDNQHHQGAVAGNRTARSCAILVVHCHIMYPAIDLGPFSIVLFFEYAL